MDGSTNALQSLVDWAAAEEAVHAALLVGSRASPAQAIDWLSDYDVVLFLREVSTYERSDEWLETFGSVLVLLHEQYELLGQAVPTRLVQYEDGLRIDFSLCSTDLLQEMVDRRELPEMLDAGYRILVDKGGETSRMPLPTGRGHVPPRPTEADYRRVINEFWWETIYVAKHLARGELLPAKYSAECVLRFECLLCMLEWDLNAGGASSQKAGAHGRGVAHLLEEPDRLLLEQTYAGAEPAGNWSALFAMTALFARVAARVGANRGFRVPEEALGSKVERFLRHIQALGEQTGSAGQEQSRELG